MKIKIKTLSSVILSPRMEKALYQGVDFKEVEMKDVGDVEFRAKEGSQNINIVYPFYSYENRELLAENSFSCAETYYIPASSLKGAVLGNMNMMSNDDEEKSFRRNIAFQDTEIDGSKIQLRSLYKFQYLYQEQKTQNEQQEVIYKTPKFTPFFPKVAIEMLKSKEEFETEVLLKISEESFCERLEKSFEITGNKLMNYIQETKNRIRDIRSWKIKDNNDCIDKLKRIEANIQQQLNENKKMIFLGGYKGILGSLSQEVKLDGSRKIKNGFYIDERTFLPYGLVEVSIKENLSI